MKIMLGAYPRIRHGQRVTRGQANRFFQQVRPWIRLANSKIARYIDARNRKDLVPSIINNVREGLANIRRHLEWLSERGFSDMKIEKDLNKLEEYLEKLEERNGHL